MSFPGVVSTEGRSAFHANKIRAIVVQQHDRLVIDAVLYAVTGPKAVDFPKRIDRYRPWTVLGRSRCTLLTRNQTMADKPRVNAITLSPNSRARTARPLRRSSSAVLSKLRRAASRTNAAAGLLASNSGVRGTNEGVQTVPHSPTGIGFSKPWDRWGFVCPRQPGNRIAGGVVGVECSTKGCPVRFGVRGFLASVSVLLELLNLCFKGCNGIGSELDHRLVAVAYP